MAGDHSHFNDARMILVGRTEIAPGETTRAVLEPILPEMWAEIGVGPEIELYDGPSWRIGRAVVTEVLASSNAS